MLVSNLVTYIETLGRDWGKELELTFATYESVIPLICCGVKSKVFSA